MSLTRMREERPLLRAEDEVDAEDVLPVWVVGPVETDPVGPVGLVPPEGPDVVDMGVRDVGLRGAGVWG